MTSRRLPSDPPSSSLLHVAKMKPGDVLPDAELLAEDGRTIKLSDFQGRALAFTFIFTRCPLPDYCPRMNQHFSRARELLLERPGGPTNWQFLSISFDPEFDKPGVLTRYAYSYRGKSADRWLFAAAPTNVMASMSSQLDFRFANEGGSFCTISAPWCSTRSGAFTGSSMATSGRPRSSPRRWSRPAVPANDPGSLRCSSRQASTVKKQLPFQAYGPRLCYGRPLPSWRP